ncbi:MAG: DUF6807 family protein [Bryobacteraceae bacterium]
MNREYARLRMTKMRIPTALLLLAACSTLAARDRFAWKDHADGRIELLETGKPVLVYNYGPQLRNGAPADRRRCCYIFPLFTPAGVSMLDDFPADHPHHRGVFWAWPVVETPSGQYDLWMFKGVAHRFGRFIETRARRKAARLVVENGWFAGDRKIVREILTLTVSPARGDTREFDVALRLEALGGPVTLRGSPAEGKSYGGLSARFAPRTGTVVRGGGAAVAGDEDLKTYPSAELEGSYEGRRALLRITPHPANPGLPYQWCLRHYGFVGASFPGRTQNVQAFTLQPGQPLTLRFHLVAADVR